MTRLLISAHSDPGHRMCHPPHPHPMQDRPESYPSSPVLKPCLEGSGQHSQCRVSPQDCAFHCVGQVWKGGAVAQPKGCPAREEARGVPDLWQGLGKAGVGPGACASLGDRSLACFLGSSPTIACRHLLCKGFGSGQSFSCFLFLFSH